MTGKLPQLLAGKDQGDDSPVPPRTRRQSCQLWRSGTSQIGLFFRCFTFHSGLLEADLESDATAKMT